MTKQQQMIIEKLNRGFRVFSTASGKVEIHGKNGSMTLLDRRAVKNLNRLESAGVLRSEYSISTHNSEFFLRNV